MCDVWEDMPDWMKEMIEESLELKAAKAKGGSQPAPAAESGGLADLAKDDEDEEDEEEIPF